MSDCSVPMDIPKCGHHIHVCKQTNPDEYTQERSGRTIKFLSRRVWVEGGRGLKEDFHLLLYTFFYSLNFVRNA